MTAPDPDLGRVSWQTPMLFRVEHARRGLAAARQRAADAVELRLAYDAARERERRRRAAEDRAWREGAAERERERVAAVAARQAEDRVWRERQAAAQAWQKAAAAHGLPRNRWIYLQRLKGRTMQSIADEVGLGKAQVALICTREKRLEEKRKARLQKTWLTNDNNKGRPIDMGGPRGVWLTYYLGDRAA